MKKFSQGFTLIELLVVISIISVLASMALLSLRNAQNKSKDIRVIMDVAQIRQQIIIDNDGRTDYGNSFTGPNTLINTAGSPYAIATTDALKVGGTINVKTNGATYTKFAIYGKLVSPISTTYYCMDSDNTVNASAGNNNNPQCP